MFNIKYPYSTDNVLNLDWILNEIKRLDTDLETLEVRVKEAAIQAAKEYIDSEMTSIRNQMQILTNRVENLSIEISNFEEEIRNNLEARLQFISNRIDSLDAKLDASVIAINARTDKAIEQNNEYLLDQITERLLPNMKVVNMFTGERVSIQEMFNYLGSLHTDQGATIDELITADKTVDEIVAINADCTTWVLSGKTLIA